MEKPRQLIFIPSPGLGHIVSLVEIMKLLLSRDEQLVITILVMKLPHIESISESSVSPISQRIKLINLPEVNMETTQGSLRSSVMKIIEIQKPNVRDIVTKLKESNTRIAGFVVDMFCASMIDVGNELGVPSYMFLTCSSAALGFALNHQALRDHDQKFDNYPDFRNYDSEWVIPGFRKPVPVGKVIPGMMLQKEVGNSFLNMVKRFREAKGILVNTFMELESHVLHALSSDAHVPTVYSVGPMLNLSSDMSLGSKEAKKKSDILEWLDDQPPLSVVFLCFGSMGSFSEEQVKEIARALEHAGYRFLWSLRQPPSKEKILLPGDYEDYTEIMPEGFLDRTAGIGKVIGWAPQVAVLAHPAVGGFVSHCGWNSVLESLWHGVPVATWPLYAEQQLNAFELEKELGLAVEIDMSFRMDDQKLVKAEQVERGIREVMKLDSDVRKSVKEMSERCKNVLMVGGSSYSALGDFIDQI